MPSYFCSAIFNALMDSKVKVVGRLIEHQDVGFLQHQLAENQARGFASGKCGGLLQRFFAAEEHLAQHGAQFFLRGLRLKLMQPFDRVHTVGDGFTVVLRKISDGDIVSKHLSLVHVHDTMYSNLCL